LTVTGTIVDQPIVRTKVAFDVPESPSRTVTSLTEIGGSTGGGGKFCGQVCWLTPTPDWNVAVTWVTLVIETPSARLARTSNVAVAHTMKRAHSGLSVETPLIAGSVTTCMFAAL